MLDSFTLTADDPAAPKVLLEWAYRRRLLIQHRRLPDAPAEWARIAELRARAARWSGAAGARGGKPLLAAIAIDAGDPVGSIVVEYWAQQRRNMVERGELPDTATERARIADARARARAWREKAGREEDGGAGRWPASPPAARTGGLRGLFARLIEPFKRS